MSNLEVVCSETMLEFWCNEVRKRGYKIIEIIHQLKGTAKIICILTNS
jgi:hypothetical protein